MYVLIPGQKKTEIIYGDNMTITEEKIKERADILKKISERENELHFLQTQVRARNVEIDLINKIINNLKNKFNEVNSSLSEQ